MKSNYNIQYSDTGKLVYFDIDMQELFNVDLSSKNIIYALNYSFNSSKAAVPIKTGLMLKSYTMDKVSNTTVRCYFDPKKIIGKKRLGRVVKEYYPQYLVNYPSRVNWLDKVIELFYMTLKSEMEKLSKKNKEINMDTFYTFLLLLLNEFNKKNNKIRDKRKKALKKEE